MIAPIILAREVVEAAIGEPLNRPRKAKPISKPKVKRMPRPKPKKMSEIRAPFRRKARVRSRQAKVQ